MDDKKIEDLFSEHGVKYRIPIYQRHYVWENNNWQHLWDDLREKADLVLIDEDVEQHFTGVIVIRGDNETREIVDGQQRLTTFQIILCVIRDLCQEGTDPGIADLIEAELLCNKSDSDLDPVENYKLLPTAESDRKAFVSLVSGNAAEGSGRIQDAYVYFRNEIEAYITETTEENGAEKKILNLFNVFLDYFRVVELKLDPTDEAAKIFEALNGRGRALSQFDHLRNNVFLRAENDRDRLYLQYWQHFNEGDWCSDEVMDHFLRNFLKAKLGQGFDNKLPQFDLYQRVYRKKLRENPKLDEDNPALIEREFGELKRYSDAYTEIANCDQDNPLWFYHLIETGFQPNSAQDNSLRFYHLIETGFKTTSWFPLILLLKSEKDKLGLSDDNLELILRSLESYIVRCLLVYGPKFYRRDEGNSIISLIKRRDRFTVNDIVEYLKQRWPNDQQVKSVLRKVGTKKQRRFTKYILFQIERTITDPSRSDVVLKFDKELNVEHVMPEEWKKNWALPHAEESDPKKRALNAERALERNQDLQSIGNLTLLTEKLNHELGNAEFLVKKEKGYKKHSRLKITKKISDLNTKKWDVEEIRERERKLLNLFCKIWPSATGVLEPEWRSRVLSDNPTLAVSDNLTLQT